MRGHGGVTGAMRLHVLRLALVILCLPRTAGSPMTTILAPSPAPSPPPSPFTGCQEATVEDTFFSTDLSSDFFPHSAYTPDPDPDPSECDLTIDVPWTVGKTIEEMFGLIYWLGDGMGSQTICVSPGTYTGITASLVGVRGMQTLRATDANNRPVFDNSAEPDLVEWTTSPSKWEERWYWIWADKTKPVLAMGEYPRENDDDPGGWVDNGRYVGGSHNPLIEVLNEVTKSVQFINLEFVNTKLVIDKAEVKVKGCKFSGGKPAADKSQFPNTNYIVFQPEVLSFEGYEGYYFPTATDDGEVSGCEFVRSSGFNGQAVAVKRINLGNEAPNMGNGRKTRPKGTLIEYNVFGGSDPSSDGYFVTAINDGGENTMIQYNTIRRFVDVRAASSDKATVDAAKADQAHGIHSEGANRSKYLGNVIAGWMPEAAGGAFKLDGSQGIELFDNWMATSGILMYSDMNAENPVPLRDIYIRSNKIYLDHTNISPSHSYDLSAIGEGQRGTSDLLIESGDIYRGIGIWMKNPLPYDNAPGAKLPDDLSGYSPPGAGRSIRIESTEVWGPHGLIYLKAHPYADISAIAEPSDLYSGSGGVFDSLACEIDKQDQGSDVPVQNSISLYNDDFATDCALPNPIMLCPEPPSAPPPPPEPPPLQRPPAQCIVDPKDGANVCISLPPGQDVNDDTDVVAQAWVQRVLKIDHATRYRLPLDGVYGVN